MPKSGHYNPQKQETKRLWYTFRNYIIHLEFHYSLANTSNTSYKNKMIQNVMVYWNEILSLKTQNEASLWLKDSYSSPSSHLLQLYEGEGGAVDFVIPKLLSTTKNFNNNSNKWKWSHSVMSDSLGSSVHRILQTRILEWVAISFSRGSSQPRDWTQVSFTIWATQEAPYN